LNIYKKEYYWKIGLLIIAIGISAASIFYNSQLASALAKEERTKVQSYARLFGEFKRLSGIEEKLRRADKTSSNHSFKPPVGSLDFSFILRGLQENKTIPVIIDPGEGQFPIFSNLEIEVEDVKTAEDTAYVFGELAKMKKGYPPTEIKITDTKIQYAYYADSNLLYRLKIYPYVQMGTVGAFLLLAYLTFSSARRAEQDQVWVGMAKETAHQLGTPLSSLMAWNELLSENEDNEVTEIAEEMTNDMQRLNLIADRFSKIGSKPKLEEYNLIEELQKTKSYVQRRAAKRIVFEDNFDDYQDGITANFSPPLIDWVIENLLKNALDAMKGEGKITLNLSKRGGEWQLDVTDTGEGIPSDKLKTVFKPGFTTKKRRGWGLGLSLSKRIVEEYHKGKIYVAESKKGKGTTFRILLPE